MPRNYVLSTFLLVFLAYALFSTLPSHTITSTSTEHNREDITPPSSPNDNRIHWRKHPEQYPLSEYTPVPTTAPTPIPRIQHHFPQESWWTRRQRVKRQKAVKKAFKHGWKSYRKHAWMKDELSPLSADYRQSFAGWGATLVDSLDTLVIMGLDDEFEEALEALKHIDFTTTDATQINVFETNIRYLGGLLGAHDLTRGKHPILLQKATELAEMLYDAFDTRNRMPMSRWEWTRSAGQLGIQPGRDTILAEIGSLNLEFTRLSQLTKDSKYFDATQRITDRLQAAQNSTKVPGLWPIKMDARDILFIDHRYSVGALADSTYEYLPKEHMMIGGRTSQYQEMYGDAMEAIKDHLLFRPMTNPPQDILFAGNYHAGAKPLFEPQMEHLKCFLGGMVGIGAKVFDRPEELAIARKLTDGCIWAYESMPTGIMPETLTLTPCDELEDCPWDEEKWHLDVRRHLGSTSPGEESSGTVDQIIKENGLPPGVTSIPDPGYKLKPEALESIFILYRLTGDKSLQDAAWRIFTSIEKMCRTDYAHAAITDVRDTKSEQEDYMESFWFAETLKYLYLIFSEPDVLSLDEYVLNTEGHPFKRP